MKRSDWLNEQIAKDTDDCILWPLDWSTNGTGYPTLRYGGRSTTAGRAVCFAVYGPPSDGDECCHSCGNRLCVNKKHLRWDTKLNNAADRHAHGTTARGESCGLSKLREDDVLAIRYLREAGFTRRELEKLYGIPYNTIRNVDLRLIWKHI